MKKKKQGSILQDRKECYITRKHMDLFCNEDLEKHHIYAGKNREVSERNGFWVYIAHYYHTGSNIAVHCRDGAELDWELKRDCQRAYERTHTRAEFMALIGRNYL